MTSTNTSTPTINTASVRDTRSKSKQNNAPTNCNVDVATAKTQPSSASSSSLDAVKTLIKNVAKDLTNKLEEIKNDLQMQINNLHERINRFAAEELSVKNSPFCDIFSKLEDRVDVLERQLHSKTIILNGIPSSSSEDLPSTFDKLCTSVNLTTPPIQEIFRVKNKNNVDGSIIVKFNSIGDKVNVLRAVGTKIKQTKKRLSLRNVGLDSDKGIFVHESLTKNNYIIFREAMRLKQIKQLTAVFIRNGIVFVRIKPSDDARLVSNFSALKELAAATNGE